MEARDTVSGVLLQHVHLHFGFGVQDGQGLASLHGRVGPELGGLEAVKCLQAGFGFPARDPAHPRGSWSCVATQRKRDGEDEEEGVGFG